MIFNYKYTEVREIRGKDCGEDFYTVGGLLDTNRAWEAQYWSIFPNTGVVRFSIVDEETEEIVYERTFHPENPQDFFEKSVNRTLQTIDLLNEQAAIELTSD